MGLDIYVGPITRYYTGDWLTIMQQIGQREGHTVRIVRNSGEEPGDAPDAATALTAVRNWQAWLAEEFPVPLKWDEGADLPYWTDKPDWSGFGAAVLLAAYELRPDLRPPAGQPIDPRTFLNSPAVAAAAEDPSPYPTLLLGVQWWLPYDDGPVVFEAPMPTGEDRTFGGVSELVAELELLAARWDLFDEDSLARASADGPPGGGASLEDVGRFGVAAMLELARKAATHHQPLLLDY
jgi:hypothetical protein